MGWSLSRLPVPLRLVRLSQILPEMIRISDRVVDREDEWDVVG